MKKKLSPEQQRTLDAENTAWMKLRRYEENLVARAREEDPELKELVSAFYTARQAHNENMGLES